MQFIADRPVIQPNLLLAAIQFLVGPDEMPRDAPGLRAVLQARSSEVAEVMDRRRTQTNEVGRRAVLLPALPRGPLAVLEVGASAGLCLLLDKFYYDYGDVHVGDPASPVRLRCEGDGVLPPLVIPDIVWRRGLDIQPIDAHDADAAGWLLACVWSDHPHRRERLAAALDLARATPPTIVRGDLVEDLERVACDAPPAPAAASRAAETHRRADDVPRVAAIALDVRVLATAAGLALLTGLIFGVVPALHGSNPDLTTSLKDGARGASVGRSRQLARASLVVAEVALAVVPLVGAALFAGSFAKLMQRRGERSGGDSSLHPRRVQRRRG